ncbi:MAG: hypothetical protein WBJ54_03335, partial [Syntrophorhabdus sp.]
ELIKVMIFPGCYSGQQYHHMECHAPGALAFGSVTIFNGNFIKGAEVSFDVSPCKSVTGCEESSLFP